MSERDHEWAPTHGHWQVCRRCAIERLQLPHAPDDGRERDSRTDQPIASAAPRASTGQSFAASGRWRVYFNRHGAAPLTWCVAPDNGGWELAVTSVSISAPAETRSTTKATPDDEDGKPSAWISVDGLLTVQASGHAIVSSS